MAAPPLPSSTDLPEGGPSTGTIATQEEKPSGLMGKIKVFVKANFEISLITFCSVLYFVVAIVIYKNLEGWDAIECIYFAMVVATTIGYGDFLPTSDSSKVATIFFSLGALTIGIFCVNTLVTTAQKNAMTAMKLHGQGHGVFNKKAIRQQKNRRCFLCVTAFAGTLVVGTVVFATQKEWDEEAGNKWINGLYLTVITVTTIGFGDYSPSEDSDEHHILKLFGILLMIFGIPVCVEALRLASQLIFGEEDSDITLKLLRGNMSDRKFSAMQEFVCKMRADGIVGSHHRSSDEISRFEYLCFILVENGVVKVNNIQNVMNNFQDMDINEEGFLSSRDVTSSPQAPTSKSGSPVSQDVDGIISPDAVGAKGELLDQLDDSGDEGEKVSSKDNASRNRSI